MAHVRVLVVDDEVGKRDQIVTFLSGLQCVSTVQQASSFEGARRAMRGQEFDWFILDMRLTTYDVSSVDDGGRPRKSGGDELLRKMSRRGVLGQAIILTQYTIFRDEDDVLTLESLRSRLQSRYPFLVDIIQFQHRNEAWKEHLQSALEGC